MELNKFLIIIMCSFTATLLIIGVIASETKKSQITPMDVYQGKTTLEYKIVDGQVIDSVVVWKSNN